TPSVSGCRRTAASFSRRRSVSRSILSRCVPHTRAGRMNFDEIIDRRHSESYKWREYPDDVIPMFVADMDFRSPEPVARALREYVDEGVFGYPRGLHATDRAQLRELTGLVVDRMRDRYDWSISPDDVVPIPGA